MRHGALMGAALTFSVFLPPVAHAQMMHGDMMGDGRHGMINLVSPADSPTQIRRGALTIGSYAGTMMGVEDGAAGLRIVLRLSGVSDASGLLTNAGNHLIFEGQLTSATDNSTPISIDRLFALKAGAAFVQVPLSISIAGLTTITIDRIAVEDSSGNPFAVPGVNLTQPTPHGSCTSDDDCDDGNPSTQDICMPMGCRHMHGHMGPGGGPMM